MNQIAKRILITITFIIPCILSHANYSDVFSSSTFFGDSLMDQGTNQGLDSNGQNVWIRGNAIDAANSALIAGAFPGTAAPYYGYGNATDYLAPFTTPGKQVFPQYFANLNGNNLTQRDQNYLVHFLPSNPNLNAGNARPGIVPGIAGSNPNQKDRAYQTAQIASFDRTRKSGTRNYAYAGMTSSAVVMELVAMLYDQGVLSEQNITDIGTASNNANINGDPAASQAIARLISESVLKSKTRIDSRGLYFYWGGANDFFNGTNGADIDTFINTVATNSMNFIELIRLAGAKNVVAFTLPDFSKAPGALTRLQAVGIDPSAILAYNELLRSKLQAANYNVILIDSSSILGDIQDNFADFGFASVDEVLLPAPDQLHPSGDGHLILAQSLFFNFLSPIKTIGSMYTTTSDTIKNTYQAIQQQLDKAPKVQHQNELFVSGQIGSQNTANSEKIRSKSIPSDATFGFKRAITDNTFVGAAISQHQQKAKQLDGISATYWQTGQIFSAFANTQNSYGFLQGIFQFGYNQYSDINRTYYLNTGIINTHGNTKGRHFSSLVRGGFHYSSSALQTGPYAEFQATQMRINRYSENETTGKITSQDIDIHNQKDHRLLMGIGWKTSYLFARGTLNYSINATLSHYFTLDKHKTAIEFNHAKSPGTTASIEIEPNEAFVKGEINLGITPVRKNSMRYQLGYTYVNGKFITSRHIATIALNMPIG